MIKFEKEICNYLNLPSIPKKPWNGKDSFKNAVCVVNLALGEQAYAVGTFDVEVDDKPRIIKYFASEPFYDIAEIFVVPAYMDTDIENADLDEESKKAAQRLAEEAKELTEQNNEEVTLPENPWFFDEIHDKEEAEAWLKDYNTRNRIRGKVPKNEETLKLRLLAIYTEMQNKNNK